MRRAYKLVRKRKDGTLGPLFINRKQRLPLGEWLHAEAHRTKGFAFRPGWHCTHSPSAPHLSKTGRVWVEVDIMGFQPHQRPEQQGGMWYTARYMKINKEVDHV